MTGTAGIYIGGLKNYTVDEFETTESDHSVTITNTDTSGGVLIKLGNNSGTDSRFEVVDSTGAEISRINADKSVAHQGNVSVQGTLYAPIIEQRFFSTMTFGNEQDEVGFPFDRPVYMLLNLMDVCGTSGVLKYNTMRIFISEAVAAGTIQGAIYKLTLPASTVGDLTTYNNSTRINRTNDKVWGASSGPTGDGVGFVDLDFDSTGEISQYTGNTQNWYFFAVRVDHTQSTYKAYGTDDIGNPSKHLENYCYVGVNNEASELGSTMQNAKHGSLNGFCLYMTLFYK